MDYPTGDISNIRETASILEFCQANGLHATIVKDLPKEDISEDTLYVTYSIMEDVVWFKHYVWRDDAWFEVEEI